MKKIMLVCAFILGVSAVSFAQGGGGGRPQRTPAEQVEQLKTQITGISDDQTKKLLVIYEAQTKSMDSLRTAANGDMAAMREKRAPLTAAYNAKIKAVLTPEQATAFQKMADERAARGFGGGGGGGPR